MPQLQDGIASSNTLYTKYEQVLKYDRQMRELATKHRPVFLSSGQIDPAWPRWVPWARQSLTISSSHKIIMIHRQFLGLSFTNSLFSFTRRTCIAAAKTILKEQRQMGDPDAPHLWIHDAFNVAACIILCLDLFYRDPSDLEFIEHCQMVKEALDVLRNTEGSMIAQRGVRLISLLLAEQRKAPRDDSGKSNKRKASEIVSTGRATKQRRFDMDAFVKTFYGGTQEPTGLSPGPESTTSVETTPQTPAQQSDVRSTEKPSEVEESYTHRLLREAEDRGRPRTRTSDDMLSPRGNFENVSSFENLLFLAQTYNF
ncbi:CMP/dCMP deaminase zinc-binding protein [Lasiodiplodia theobromae]|nr:CMP/dCMP deaminase zinc-binding protein [Lasiodiplodia theobromae]